MTTHISRQVYLKEYKKVFELQSINFALREVSLFLNEDDEEETIFTFDEIEFLDPKAKIIELIEKKIEYYKTRPKYIY
jgi:hypothetical protein